MSRRRSDAAAAVVDSKVRFFLTPWIGCHQNIPQIYICGGFDGVEPTNSVEVFDTNWGAWTSLSPMSRRRSGVKVNFI